MIEEINKEVQNCPETIFDTFDLGIDLRLSGNSLKDKLVEMTQLYGRINQLASNALLLYEQAKTRQDEVISLAWDQVDRSMKITAQKMAVKTIPIKINGEITSITKEEERVNLYSYIRDRGKDKVKEMSTILDVGRTLLSWDKQEQMGIKN